MLKAFMEGYRESGAPAPETDWVEHDGDMNKVPYGIAAVEIMDRGGQTYLGLAEDFDWVHAGHGLDIIRWRYA